MTAPGANDRRRLAVILNPNSAGGKPLRVLPDVEAELAQLGLPYRVIESRDPDHAGAMAREAAEVGELVVALGGDGLVGLLAAALQGAGPMGVLPGGRGNDFARAVGISLDLREACRVLATGSERRLDLGVGNGHPFACIASTGFDSEANRLANETKLIKGNLVYAYAGFRTLAAWKPAHFKVQVDAETLEFSGYSVSVANTSYFGGGMKVAPDADPADGLLDVILVGDAPKLRFLSHMPKVFKGEHVELPSIKVMRAREVTIEADRDLAVYADGDPLTKLPARIGVRPGQLRLIAP